MWHLRRVAQHYAADVLRPFTVVAQVQHWRRTGERLWFSLAQLFAAWKHQAAFLRQHGVLRRQGRRAKRDMLSDQVQQAWDADRQGDKSAIWQVIRRLAPKTAKTRVQLRGPRGELLTQQEETDRFIAYCQKVYHAPPEPGPLLTDLALVGPGPLPESSTPLDPGAAPASGSRPPPVLSTSDVEASSPLSRSVSAACPPSDSPLDGAELHLALTTLPARKATPSHLAQLLLWHLGKDVIVPHLAALCTQLWRHPDKFHQLWADAWVAWLPKPGKAPDQPENLRPISLTEGGGRIVVKALTMRLRPFFAEATRLWPQYAYTPGRSIEHAIARALHTVLRSGTRSHRLTPTSCQGEATLSIDTSKAFDTVDRRVLEQELRAARVPEPELEIILNLHRNIGYWPAGSDPGTRVSSERGVRQGCPLAPSLWTLITVALLRTTFADDLLMQWVFT